ncbi:uncharacterized protein LTR77_011077 [Saxophila tyrrhenica]|uniref:Vacuolar protein sorting-associated protein 54 n=1 Tax=Saxophila tyrrhenica TaxID=1690608 RepID=A0AAV9NWX3_9PEZI|nr:hypothetical protein LTR77_011077 [Saxophila tyrrhenica]
MASPSFSIDGLSPDSPTSQRSGYPFPETSARRSTSNRYRPRRGSAASNTSVSSIGGSLDTHTRRGSAVRETSQNAISTLLQPPIVRTGLLPHSATSAAAAGYKAPTTRDIPPVTLTNIPHVAPESFRNYLSRIGPLFESFQRGRAEPEQAQWLKKDRELEKTDRFAEALDRRWGKDGLMSPTTPRTAHSPLLSPTPQTPGGDRRRATGSHRRNRNEPTPLTTIPSVYFDEDFHLENPRTFDVVSERAEIVRPPPGTPQPEQKAANGTPLPPRKALATNAILQEKLSWYMDTVEVHLINSISTASSGFFAALGSLKELQTEAEESVAKIQSLREDLRRLDQEVAVAGLEVAAKRRRRANLGKLGAATAQVQQVVENVKRADELVEEGNFDEAADQMDRVGRLVCGQPEDGGERQLIDLRPLKALQGLDSGLQELQLKIGTGFANRLTTILMSDLRQHIEKVPSSDTLKRWSRQRGIPPTYMETTPEFRANLLSALKGLQRAGYTAPATAAYREAVTKEMKAIIRRYLPSSNDEDADSMVSSATTSTRGGGRLSQQEKSSILARNLRALDAEDAEGLLVKVYTNVGEALRRVGTQTKILLDITSGALASEGGKGHSRSASMVAEQQRQMQNELPKPDELSQALDMSSLLGQAVDTAQTQITRVLKVRNEQSVRLAKPRFLRYFALNRLFADECEAVSGRGGQALKGLINAQISGFVQVLGTAETERIAQCLDNDSWNTADFSEDDDKILQRVLGGMSLDPPEWSNATPPIWEPADHQLDAPQPNGTTTPNPTVNGTPTPASTKVPAAKPAYIDSTRFLLVPSALALLPTLDTLLALTTSLPSLTPQLSAALLDVLRTFNSRACQLVLGAGATRGSAGLKNITTKHLALAHQAVGFVVALVPYLRECVRRHLPAGSKAGGEGGVLGEWEKVRRVCQEHQRGIGEKLVEIMTTRSGAHVKALHALDLAAVAAVEGDVDEEKGSQYVETLTRETLTLYRVLSRHLNEVDVGVIMGQIGEAYKGQWSKVFQEKVFEGEQQGRVLMRDARVLERKLGTVEGLDGVGKEVVRVVEGRVGGGG